MPRITKGRFIVKSVYDFAVDGGATGTLALRGEVVPEGATVVDSWIRVLVALASATGTGALQVEAAQDVQATAAASAAPWSTTGSKRGSASGGTSLPLASVVRTPSLVIATAVLTAGQFELYLDCVDPA